jgi:hypothetical protein
MFYKSEACQIRIAMEFVRRKTGCLAKPCMNSVSTQAELGLSLLLYPEYLVTALGLGQERGLRFRNNPFPRTWALTCHWYNFILNLDFTSSMLGIPGADRVAQVVECLPRNNHSQMSFGASRS